MENSFGHWVRRRRKALDLTQAELARRVGCSLSAIFKIESDERRPSRQVAELLAAHLEIPPGQRELFMKVARQEKAADRLEDISPLSGFEPKSTKDFRRAVLPKFPTQIVGREPEIDFVVRQMRDPACRMLTLTGPGGVGKTRLAVEAARRLEPFFASGVLFLSMSSVNLPESIAPAIASGLGIVFSGPADPWLQVLNVLRDQEILLIFDNMEHLLAGGDILAEILKQSPSVRVLATSREQLHLQWEWLFEVQGLPIPEQASLQALETNSAARLFLQRARQATPGGQAGDDMPLDGDERDSLIKICRAVEGLPLAIELAASWVRVMSLAEIARELDQGLDLLETPLLDVPARHRSMRVVFDHSWALLTGEERAALMVLAVFPGSFTRRAAEAVAGIPLPLLSSLVSKSLLRFNLKAGNYDFHELVRQNALARLQAQPVEAVQAHKRFSEFYSGWLAKLDRPLKSARQMQVSTQIRLETANWMAAWRWAVENHRLDLLRPMLPCLYWYYEIHGDYAEALSSYRYAVIRLRECGAPDCLASVEEKCAYAFLVDQLGWFEFRTGDVEKASALFAESHQLVRDFQDHEVLYHIHGNWGYMALLGGNSDKAWRLTMECLENARALQSAWHIAIPTSVLGIIELQRGNLVGAHRQLTDSLWAWREVGDPRGIIFVLLYLGSTALARGDLETASAVLHESIIMAEDKDDRWAQATGLDLVGQAAIASGNPESAISLIGESIALSEEIGDQWSKAQAMIHLGEAYTASGFCDDARRLYREAYESARLFGWTLTMLEAQAALAEVETGVAVEVRLASLMSVLLHPALTPAVRLKAERLRDQLAAALTPEQLKSAEAIATGENAEQWARALFASDVVPWLMFGEADA